MAREALEDALRELTDSTAPFDRERVAQLLRRGIQCAYTALDTEALVPAHLLALQQGARVVAEARALLESPTAPRPALDALKRGLSAFELSAESVAAYQLKHRDRLHSASAEGEPRVRPFRASRGQPSLQAFTRDRLIPMPELGQAPEPTVTPTPPPVERPTNHEALRALAQTAVGTATSGLQLDDESPEPEDSPPAPLLFIDAAGEREEVRRIALDHLENLAAGRDLRTPNAMESWFDQAPFEENLLASLDAFLSFGSDVLPLPLLFHAEADSSDPACAFAAALALGSVEGDDTIDALVQTMVHSAPESYPGFIEGLALASHPGINRAMKRLAVRAEAPVVCLALDVLHRRGASAGPVVESLLSHDDDGVAWRAARAAHHALGEGAIQRLTVLLDIDHVAFVHAAESLLLLGDRHVREAVRRCLAGKDGAGRPATPGSQSSTRALSPPPCSSCARHRS